MANYTVKNLTGDALTEGSLLYAIAQVNAGLYDGITFDSSLNGSVIDFSELETLNGTVSVSNGTLDNFTGEITVTSEGDGYGITGSRGTRSITNSTGSITVNASANAYGINSYFQESTSYYDRTTSLDFNSMALNLTIASTTSDAFGIRMYSYLYRVSNYSDYRKSTCKLIADDIVGDISVNAALCGYGINLYGYGDGGNGYANLDVDTISSHITVTGGTDAYGIYAYGSASNGAEISVKELNENVDITAGTGTAYGIYSSGKINGGYKEVVTKEAEYAEDGTLISEAVTESQEQAMIVSGHVTVSSESGAAYGVATNGSMLLSIADTGKISGNSTNGTAYGVWTGGLLTLKSMAGEIILNTEGTAGTTIGIHAASGMFENITGNINVTTSAAGYGIGGSYGSRNITNSTGSITVKAIDRAVGIEGNYSYNYSNATTSLTFDEMALLLNITSSSKDAYGIRLNTNNDYYYYHNEVRSNLTTGDITGHITVTGALDGYGIYLYGRSGFGYANLDAETISSNITVNGGTDAYGIYAYGSASNGAEISVKELNGNVDITAGTGTAYGIYSSGKIEIDNLSGSISVSGQKNSYGIKVYNLSSNVTLVQNIGDLSGKIDVYSQAEEAIGINMHCHGGYSSIKANTYIDNFTGSITATAHNAAQAIRVDRLDITGDFTGILHAVSFGDNADFAAGLAINTGGMSGYFTGGLTMNDMAGEIYSQNLAGRTYGIYANSNYSLDFAIGLVSGSITVVGNESYGVYSSDKINGGYKDVVTKEAEYAEDGTLVSEAVTESQEQAMIVSGTVIADGETACGIKAGSYLYTDIRGIIAAGNFGTNGDESKISTLQEQLENFSHSQWYAANLISAAKGQYAISSGSGNDVVTVSDGGLILGNIALGGGTNTLTVSSGALIYGDITASRLNLNFTVDTAPSKDVMITAKSAGALIGANTNYTINLSSDSQSGRYVLASADDLSALANKTFTVNYLDSTYTVRAEDDLEDNPFVDINIINGKELELVVSNTFFVYNHNIANDMIGKDRNDSITLSFSKALDTESFSLDLVDLTGKNGKKIAITSYEINGNKLTLNYDPITEEGKYTLKLSEKIKNVDGGYLDQNLNQTVGEADDSYTLDLTADFTAPKVTRIEPAEEFAGTLETLRIYFSSPIDFSTIQNQVKLITPSGNEILPLSAKQISSSIIELAVPTQTAFGSYQIVISDGIKDLAGNNLECENGIQVGTFQIADIDLRVSDVSISKNNVGLGEYITVKWDLSNPTETNLLGSWTDGIYLSKDEKWDIQDILVSKYEHQNGMQANTTFEISQDIALSGVTDGDYYILIRSDIYMEELNAEQFLVEAKNVGTAKVTVSTPELTIGESTTYTVKKSGDFATFKVGQSANESLDLVLDSSIDKANLEIYVAYGYVPTREKYDLQYRNVTDGNFRLPAQVSAQEAYILVYAKNTSQEFTYTITPQTIPMEITSITPASQGNSQGSMFDISGVDFQTGATVTLIDAQGNVYTPDKTSFINSSRIRISFDADKLPANVYDLVVSTGFNSVKQEDSITILDESGYELNVSLQTPSSVGYHLVSELTLTYSNNGYDTMDAPLIIVKPSQTHANGIVTSEAILTLDESLVQSGFWVKNMPEGFSSSIQILGAGNMAGTLAADGKTYSTTIYYTGWLQNTALFGNSLYGWDPKYPAIDWNTVTITSDNTQYLNWGTVFKNTGYSGELNAQLASAFATSVGTTWGKYVGMLNANLRYLDEIGYDTDKLAGDDVFKFEVLQEVGSLSPFASLLSNVDFSEDSVLPLVVERTYNTDLISRDKNSSFGYGWISNLDDCLIIQTDGDVVFTQGTASRTYQQNWTNGYQTVCGDGSVLKKLSSGYRLTEANGTKWLFSSDGKIQSVTLATGEKASYSYDSNGALSRISGDNGNYLLIERNVNGNVTQVKNSSGNNISYSYDTQGNLISATNSNGEDFTYEYADDQAHALTKYTDESGVTTEYTYSATGLLASISSGNKNISIVYGKDGDVTLTDGAESITLYYSIDGTISRLVNNQTGITNFYYFDKDGNFASGLDSNNEVVGSTFTFAGTTFTVTADENVDLSKFTFAADYDVNATNYYKLDGFTCYKTDAYGNSLGKDDNPDEWYLAKYDAEDTMVSYTEYKNGITTTYTFTEEGYSVSVDDPSTYYVVDGITYYKRDSEGNVVAKEDNTTDSQNRGYDADGNLVYYSITADGSSTEYVYDAGGNITSLTDKDGTISYTYDSNGKMTSTTYADGSYSNYTYYDDGSAKSIVNSDGSYAEYDTYGNIIKQSDADGNMSEFTYTYDANGNVLSMQTNTGVLYSYTYDAEGNKTAASSTINGKTTAYTFDTAGNTTGITYADGSQVFYTYDDKKQMTSFTDAKGQLTQYAYNDGGQVTSITYADGTTDLYTYDTDNNRLTWTNRAGESISYTVSDGKTTRIQYADGRDIAITYNESGNVSQAGDMKFVYNEDSNIASIAYDNGGTISYTYSEDVLASITVDGMQSAYTYTDSGDIDTIQNGSGVLLVDYDYDEKGNIVKVTKGNGTYSLYSYADSTNGKVSAIDNYNADGVLSSWTHYTYDADGLVSAKATESGSWSYTYDAMGQLLSESFTATGAQSASDVRTYTYDAAGNRLSQNINGTVTTYTYNDLNQIVTANGFTYRYDANGNLLEDEERLYTWTTDNKVASETDKATGESWEYTYNALGYRTGVAHKKTDGTSSTTRYAVDASGNVLAEYLDDVLVKNYIQGNGLAGWTDNEGNTYYFNSDILGSTTEITDTTGNVANTYKYDAWGNLLDCSSITVDNDFTYVGSYGLMANDSGTYYVRARNYDAENGRWISADPIGIEGGNNLYGYCGNSPSQRVDINGYGHFYYWALGGEYSAPKNFWEKIGSKLSTAFVVGSRVLDRFDLVVAHEQYILDDYDKSSWGFGVLPDTGAYGGVGIALIYDATELGRHKIYGRSDSRNYDNDKMAIAYQILTGINPYNYPAGYRWEIPILEEAWSIYNLTGPFNHKNCQVFATELRKIYDKLSPAAQIYSSITDSGVGHKKVYLDAMHSSDKQGTAGNIGVIGYLWVKNEGNGWEWIDDSLYSNGTVFQSSIVVGQDINTTVTYGVAVADGDGCWNENGTKITLNGKEYYVATTTVNARDMAPVANARSSNGTSYQLKNGESTHEFKLTAKGSRDSDGQVQMYMWSYNGKVVSNSCDYNVTLGEGSHTYTLVVYDNAGQKSNQVSITLNVRPQSPPSSSQDPNDKTVTEGFGEKGYVAAGETLNYMIEFENDPEFATAPARWVRVYDTLDTSKVDIDSFELKSFCIAGNFFNVGDGRDSFNDTVKLNILGVEVMATVAINLETDEDTGETRLVCEFMAIDPTTGAMLMDVDKGILAVNDALGSGEGWIKYSLDAIKDLPSGTEITNMAEIYFDFNGVIETPTTVNTIDSVNPVFDGFTAISDGGNQVTFTLNGSDADSGIKGYNIAYSTDGEVFNFFTTVTGNSWTCEIDLQTEYFFKAQAIDNVGNVSDWSEAITVTQNIFTMPENYSKGEFESIAFNTADGTLVIGNGNSIVHLPISGESVDIAGLSAGTYQWESSDSDGNITASGTLDGTANGAEAFVSKANGNQDIFFAQTNGKWTSGYAAQHNGNLVNNWSGTQEQVTLTGKNKIEDIFIGSKDSNVLFLTDDSNGDALFLDDIYTNGVTQSRISGIDKIIAGAGDDVIDFTSSRYAYVGTAMEVYGGNGNDTIWMASGENTLFGDAGNDRIVGGFDDDVIVGGSGNDSMHGGGGEDIFCFGGDWGKDTVEQLAGGEITLWFESGSADNWNADTLTYTDGTNSVKVSGISADNISLKFGDDSSDLFNELSASGCFDDAASEKIFEDKNKGMLA